ncbi:kinase-like domain-containing protein [Rhizophagus irregularis DAOM 181602=DAOM 197198]|nr:kinase-like domain-containing protein [Rhizophagus irregularis DAOM 181602=DAOM 197198]
MSAIRYESILAAIQKANELTDYYDNYNDLDTQHEFQKQIVLADTSLTENEKTEAIRELNKIYDRNKVLHNEGIKRIWNFPNWTSGNDDVDDLIQKYQMESFRPDNIVEWIPYNNLQNFEYLTEGGFSEIYTATWIDGKYEEWDSKEIKLKRFGDIKIILKKLGNVESANRRWFEEAKTHLTISNKWPQFVQCFGLTQDLSNGSFMLVMYKMDTDLRKYLQQTHNQLTWKEKIKIAYGTPLRYANLMKKCWDADPVRRPDINTLVGEIFDMYENKLDELPQPKAKDKMKTTIPQPKAKNKMKTTIPQPKAKNKMETISSKSFTSKIYNFENLPEPRNATEKEQIAPFYISRSYDFSSSDNSDNISSKKLSKVFKKLQINSKNVDDFNNLSNEKNVNTESSEYKVDKSEINSNYIMQDDHKKEIEQQAKKHSLDINDDDEKQDELEISGNVSKKIRTS